MSPLARLCALLVFTLFIATVGHRLGHPVRRTQINPQQTHLRININEADIATLSLLSGISSKLGENIVEHRRTMGPFRSLEDLDRVRFIGPSTMRKIGPYITFGSASDE